MEKGSSKTRAHSTYFLACTLCTHTHTSHHHPAGHSKATFFLSKGAEQGRSNFPRRIRSPFKMSKTQLRCVPPELGGWRRFVCMHSEWILPNINSMVWRPKDKTRECVPRWDWRRRFSDWESRFWCWSDWFRKHLKSSSPSSRRRGGLSAALRGGGFGFSGPEEVALQVFSRSLMFLPANWLLILGGLPEQPVVGFVGIRPGVRWM